MVNCVFFLCLKGWWSVSLMELKVRCLAPRTRTPSPCLLGPSRRRAGRSLPAAEEWRSVAPLLLSVNSLLLLKAETRCRKRRSHTGISMMAAATQSLTSCVTSIKLVTHWSGSFLTSPRMLTWKERVRRVRTRWRPSICHQLVAMTTCFPCPGPSLTAAKRSRELAGKDCLPAATAAKLLTGLRKWRSTSVSTQGRSLSAAPHAGRCSQRPGTWENTRESTLGRNRTPVGCVAGDLPG